MTEFGRMRLPLTACLLVALSAEPAVALEWRVTPEASVDAGFTDNVELAPRGGEASDTVVAAALGGRFHFSGTRGLAAAELRLERLEFREHPADHQDRIHLLAAGTFPLVSDLVSLSGQVAIEDVFIDSQGALSSSRFNVTDNRGRVKLYRVSPSLHDGIDRWAEYEISYSRTHVTLPTAVLDDTDTDEASAVLKSGPEFTRVAWALTYNTEHTRHEVPSAEDRRWLATLDLRIGVAQGVFLLLGGGQETIEDHTLPEPIEGPIGQVGMVWQPSPRLTLLATAGHRFDDTVYGLDFAAAVGPRTTLTARHDEGLQSAQRLLRTNLGHLGTTPEGSLRDQHLEAAFSLGDRTFGLAAGSFRQKRTSLALGRQTPRDSMRLEALSESRTFVLTDDTEAARGGEVSWEHALSRSTRLAASVARQRVEFSTVGPRKDVLTNGSLEAVHVYSSRVELRFIYRHNNRSSNVATAELEENVYSLGIYGTL